MPHSSGGGSHSGGSHSSSSSSSFSSGGGSHSGGTRKATPITVSSPTKGYSRYAFYTNSGIKYKYVKDAPELSSLLNLFLLIVYLPFYIGIGGLLLQSIQMVRPIDMSSYQDHNIAIYDYAGIITDEEENVLNKELKNFRDKTGITPVVMTDYNENWTDYYYHLENYAYDLYVNMFTDEKHWLIIYTEPEYPDPQFNDWYFEGMQGDDTDRILSENVTTQFNENLQKLLTDNKYSVGDSFIYTFRHLTKNNKITGFHIEKTGLGISALFLIFITGHMMLMLTGTIKGVKESKKAIEDVKKKGIPVSENVNEDVCEYCNGVYIHGIHIACPHCGAPIKKMQEETL